MPKQTQYYTILLLLIYIAIAITTGAESFSHHHNYNTFNRTKTIIVHDLHLLKNHLTDIQIDNISDSLCLLTTLEQQDTDSIRSPTIIAIMLKCQFQSRMEDLRAITMESQYQSRMEDLRKDLLETIPRPLLDASRPSPTGTHVDSDIEKATDFFSDLLETIPRPLLDASRPSPKGTHADSDIDKATDFLDAHSRRDKKDWKRKLEAFVALKEAVDCLRQNNNKKNSKSKSPSSPMDFPEALLEKLLDEQPDLLEEMLLADGASGGNYGKAMEIYEEIYRESDCVEDSDHPILHRLALAIALVHATPVVQTNPLEPSDEDDVEDVVDPVRRYLNYETAYLEGELDPAFDTLTTWELRFVVDGDEPDEISAWGRKTLRHFHPDHALARKPDWLYAAIVRTDIPYGSSRVQYDDPKLHKYQNILRNGGICGRRAFFGRFILRAFGIPTTARPSKGHAALCHWKPDDGTWVVNLGGGFGKGWTKTRYVKDLDFEAMTRARNHSQLYEKVKLAQWIGDLFDEKRVYGIHSENSRGRGEKLLLDLQNKSDIGLWYRLSLKVQESILETKKNARRGKGKGAAPVDTIINIACREKAKAGACFCAQDSSGKTMIRIPASSYANPRKTKDVKVMKGIFMEGLANPDIEYVETMDKTCNRPMDERIGNQQIYLPSFTAEGTTIMRGGTWKNDANDLCNSGTRLLSGGMGKYNNWGLRAALTAGEEDGTACPDPQISVDLGNSVTMEMVYIPPGTFVMGGTETEEGRFACIELPHHRVQITKGFYIGKYPVTQDQYAAVRNGKNPSKSTRDPKCPVDNIGVEDALKFCEEASEAAGVNIRLPTEAEWEYSTRGTTNGICVDPQLFFGNDASKLADYAWCKQNSGGKSHPVGLKLPNPFGLYDIYGNVCERVSDTYHKAYYAQGKGGVMVDPTGPTQGTKSKLTYEIPNVPESGTYLLTAKVCTVNVEQRLRVSTKQQDDDGAPTLDLPYTVGNWMDSAPVSLQLQQGKNTLHFWRDAPPQYGISIQEFVLTKAD